MCMIYLAYFRYCCGQGLLAMVYGRGRGDQWRKNLWWNLCKNVDDVVMGRDTQEGMTEKYIRVLEKLHNTNLKISLEKTDILRWSERKVVTWKHLYMENLPWREQRLMKLKQYNIWGAGFAILKLSTLLSPQIFHTFLCLSRNELPAKTPRAQSHGTLRWIGSSGKQKILSISLPPSTSLENDTAQVGVKNVYSTCIGHILFASTYNL